MPDLLHCSSAPPGVSLWLLGKLQVVSQGRDMDRREQEWAAEVPGADQVWPGLKWQSAPWGTASSLIPTNSS